MRDLARVPLNGTRTHPLKPASIAVLRNLASHDIERYAINAGVIDRLSREDLIEVYTPRRGHRAMVRITPTGRERLASIAEDGR